MTTSYELAGQRYTTQLASDVSRDGMSFEVWDAGVQVLEVFAGDNGTLTFSAFRRDLPTELVEWAIAQGRAALSVPAAK